MRSRIAITALASLAACAACATRTAPPADREGFVPAGDVRLHYRILGAGPDTLVALHGGPGAGIASVLPMVEPLADGRAVLLFDQRGGGRSTLPEDTTALRPEDYVADLEAVRRHFGLERMTVLTHSFGAVLIAEYAKAHPERLERVVLHGATGPVQAREGAMYRARAASTSPADTAAARRASAVLGRLLEGTADDPVEDCREYERITRAIAVRRGEPAADYGTTCAMPPEAVRYYYRYTAQLAPRYYGGWDYSEGLEAVTAPALAVYGARDTLGHPGQRDWVRAWPEARLLLVPGAGKGALADAPGVAIPAIEAFLDGRWPDGTEP